MLRRRRSACRRGRYPLCTPEVAQQIGQAGVPAAAFSKKQAPDDQAPASCAAARGRYLILEARSQKEVASGMAVQIPTPGIDIDHGVGGRVQEIDRLEREPQIFIHVEGRREVEPSLRQVKLPKVA